MRRGAAIRTDHMTEVMRSRVVDLARGAVLVSRIQGSDQQPDLTAPTNAAGLGRRRHFRRTTVEGWPGNPLPILPASRWLGIDPPETMQAQVFQLAGCAWRCWYCFVPFPMLSADVGRSEWRTASELLDLYLSERDRPAILDLSGGSPDLAPEWISWTMDAIEERCVGRDVYLWSDDNLSSDRLLVEGRSLLKRMERYGPGYGKACCLKGFDPPSFAFNTGAEEEGFEAQLRILAGYAGTSLDLHIYVTLTSPPRPDDTSLIGDLVQRLARIRPDLPLRTVPLLVSEFSPMRDRLDSTRRSALSHQFRLVEAWHQATEVVFPR